MKLSFLFGLLLPDSGHIQEEDASDANHRQSFRKNPTLPLYTEEDARACAYRA